MASHTGDVTLDTGRATAAPVRLGGTGGTAILDYTRGCQVQGGTAAAACWRTIKAGRLL